ncbi:hypothetical protein [Parashewanella tropica]|uniref:hypothetical protein n=1 Tax=Parashewanella tropica TaxID=2547970 RepID=UPI00105A83CE|nr:hypothetical protein [Parashewanella tropica]
MDTELLNIIVQIFAGSWLVFFPNHLMFVIRKYQLFLFKYTPLGVLVFKTEKEAQNPIFNRRAVRAIGFFIYLGAIVTITKVIA